MLVASFAIGAGLFGLGGDVTLMDNAMDVFDIFPFSLFLMTLSFAAGVFTTSLGLSIGIGLFFNVFSSMFGLLAGKYAWSKFVVLKYTSLAHYVPGSNDPLGITLGFALGITVIYIAVVVLASIVRFKTKEIN
jgi:ABC-type transport system involved in multi-copper enzyme maturation permease subunit